MKISGLSTDQERVAFLTQEVGLELAEALHAIGRRSGCWPGNQRLTRQEQFNKMREYIGYGLTEQEARRVVVGIPSTSHRVARRRKPTSAKKPPNLDWMPAKQAYGEGSPGRSRRGLLK